MDILGAQMRQPPSLLLASQNQAHPVVPEALRPQSQCSGRRVFAGKRSKALSGLQGLPGKATCEREEGSPGLCRYPHSSLFYYTQHHCEALLLCWLWKQWCLFLPWSVLRVKVLHSEVGTPIGKCVPLTVKEKCMCRFERPCC